VLLSELQQDKDVEYLELARAVEAAAAGQHARARQSLVSLAKQAPNDVDVAVERGELELRARDPKAALEAWTVAESTEKSARSAYGLARARAALGQAAEAQKLAREAIQRNPDHGGARVLVAATLWDSTRRGRVRSCWQTWFAARQLEPGRNRRRSNAARRDSPRRCASRTRRLQRGARDQSQGGASARGLGDALYRAGRYSEALARFEAAVQADPMTLRQGRRGADMQRSNVQDARDALKKLTRHASQVDGSRWYGKVSEAQAPQEAEDDIEQRSSSAANPDVVRVTSRCRCSNQLGRSEEARQCWPRRGRSWPIRPPSTEHSAAGALQGRYEDSPNSSRRSCSTRTMGAKFKLACAAQEPQLHQAQAFDEVAVVDRDYRVWRSNGGCSTRPRTKEEALKGTKPRSPRLRAIRIDAAGGLGKVAMAAPASHRALAQGSRKRRLGRNVALPGRRWSRAPTWSKAQHAERSRDRSTERVLDVRRRAANEAGRTGRAETALAKALELDQGLADAYWQRGVLLVRQGAVKDAVNDLKKALELRPSRFEAHAALADAYRDLGMEGEALTQWQKAVAAMPDNATWRFRYGTLLVANRKNAEARDNLARPSTSPSRTINAQVARRGPSGAGQGARNQQGISQTLEGVPPLGPARLGLSVEANARSSSSVSRGPATEHASCRDVARVALAHQLVTAQSEARDPGALVPMASADAGRDRVLWTGHFAAPFLAAEELDLHLGAGLSDFAVFDFGAPETKAADAERSVGTVGGADLDCRDVPAVADVGRFPRLRHPRFARLNGARRSSARLVQARLLDLEHARATVVVPDLHAAQRVKARAH
jgi:tetratricopeptide (TPR) repeat protein